MSQNNQDSNTGSMFKPPMLKRNEYFIWQRRMGHILAQQNTGCWRSVVFGPHVPMIPSTEDPNKSVPKNPENYSEQDFLKIELDAKAFSIVASALPNEIYAGLLHCNSAKELWDALKEQFGGTEEVIENNREVLNQQYETFCHVKGESLTQQFERYSCLISELKLVDVNLPNSTINSRFLRSLPDKWETIAYVTRTSAGYKEMTLTQLHGRLLTYERELNQKRKLQESGKMTDDYTLGNTALYSREEGSSSSKDQSYDHFIDITSGSNFNTDSYTSNYAFAANEIQTSDNLSFELNDLQHFEPTDLEEMDILHQLALLSVRASKFYKRTGRQFPGLHGGLKVGLDKSKIKCYKCNRLGHFARECRSQTAGPIVTHPGPRPQSTAQNTHYTPAPQMQNTAHFAHPVTSIPIHYIQAPAPQIQYVQAPPQVNVQQAPQVTQTTQTTAPAEVTQQSFFTQGFVDWSSLPEDLTDENFALMATNDFENENICLMAFETSGDGGESVEQVGLSDVVVHDVESVFTSVVEEGYAAEEKETLSDPREQEQEEEGKEEKEESVEEAATQVSPQILRDLCSDKCIIAFANVKKVNENLRSKMQIDELNFEKLTKELKSKLVTKDAEISDLKHEASIIKDQLQTMIEKYQVCKKELESTQITCERWVESCKGFEMILESQVKSNIKFGLGFRNYDLVTENVVTNDSKTSEIIPKNEAGEEIRVTDKKGNKITLEKHVGSSSKEPEKYKFKPTWADECDVLENFKPMDFTNSEGIPAPKAKIVPIKDLPAVVKTSAEKETLKSKKKGKITHLFCEFCNKRNHVSADCFLLKAYDINKTSVIPVSTKCEICNKTNHSTQKCVYLKPYEITVQETKLKTFVAQGSSSDRNKFHQRFEPTETEVTKALSNTFHRDIQVTDAPSSNHVLKIKGQKPFYNRVPFNYEALKRPSKSRVNKHPFGYQSLMGKNTKQWLQKDDTKSVLTTDLSSKSEVGFSETLSSAALDLDDLLD